MEETFAATDVGINATLLDRAATATGGYPFLIQLVGYHVWRLANRDAARTVTDDALTEGLEAARRRLGSTVLATAIADLSDVDKTFLLMMADDDGPSKMSDLAARMGETSQYANVYRQRLIDAAVIESMGRGLVDFAVPYLREWLQEHAASVHRPGRG